LIPKINKQNRRNIILKNLRMFSCSSLICLCALLLLTTCSAEQQTLCEWSSFHGPDRTNKSTGTGLLSEWPEEGPPLLWSTPGLGEGFSTVSFGGGFIYTAGVNENQSYVFCFDLDGKLIWKSPNGNLWSTRMSHASSYTGPRSTPTYDDGLLYHLGDMGRLAAFDAISGKEIWYKDLMEEFDAGTLEYGYAESVLTDGDRLYVRPAGRKGFLVCLDKNNGEVIWVNNEIPGVEGYTSAIKMDFGGYRQILGSSSDCYYGVDSETGKLLWKVDFVNQQGLNITDPVIYNDHVFISSGYGKGSRMIRLKSVDGEIIPETVWETELMDNHHGGVILHEGFLYGSGSSARGWFCLDFSTGDLVWNDPIGKGSITYADGMLYLLDERGSIRLVRATPERFEVSGEFRVPEGGRGMYWAHPVVCGGRLYIRHADMLFAYDISGE